MEELVPRLQQDGHPIQFVRMAEETGLCAANPLLCDCKGIHPTHEGYKRVAKVWFEAMKADLDKRLCQNRGGVAAAAAATAATAAGAATASTTDAAAAMTTADAMCVSYFMLFSLVLIATTVIVLCCALWMCVWSELVYIEVGGHPLSASSRGRSAAGRQYEMAPASEAAAAEGRR
jgi:hypothetical protein